VLCVVEDTQDHDRHESLEKKHEQRSAGVSLRVDLTSYDRPDATVKILISACLGVDTPVSADEILRQGNQLDSLDGTCPNKELTVK
jgi:hypothetical protein